MPIERRSTGRHAAILVVDADPLARLIAREILEGAGFGVSEARDAEEALASFGTREQVPVAVLDHRLPGETDGLALARLVHERSPGTGILMTSGELRSVPAELPPGALFLRKPYWRAALVRAVDDLLEARDAAGGIT